MNALRDALKQYVALRRALGTRLEEPARTLVYFLDFLEREGADHITSALALRWAMEPKDVQRATWARRLGMVRCFAAWLSTVDAQTEIPSKRLLAARRQRNKPHIFTDDEIDHLMQEAAGLASPTGLRALTYATLIGLLTATGLRPGEALALDRSDVDLENGILSIRRTKFGKPDLCRLSTPHGEPSPIMQSSAIGCVDSPEPKPSWCPSAATGFAAPLLAAHSRGFPARSVCAPQREPDVPAVGQGFRISDTVSRPVSSLSGIGQASMYPVKCRSSRHTSGT